MSEEMLGRLQAYCTRAFPTRAGVQVKDLTCITDGWENEVYAFDLEYEANGASRREGLILRIYPGDDAHVKSAREFQGMRQLHQVGYPVPQMQVLEQEKAALGRPFVIMERIEGQGMWSLLARSPVQKQLELLTQFCELFVRLHALDWRLFVEDAARYETGGPYALIDQWLREARNALRRFDKSGLADLIKWLEERRTTVPCSHPAVVHYDFHPANVLVRDDGSAVVIDWTGLHVSDARFDLAWTLLLSYAYAGVKLRDLVLQGYERLIGASVEQIEYFEVCACCRRLFDIAISLSLGAEKQGMRPGAVEAMKQQRGAIENVYSLLRERTGLRVPEIERLLVSLG